MPGPTRSNVRRGLERRRAPGVACWQEVPSARHVAAPARPSTKVSVADCPPRAVGRSESSSDAGPHASLARRHRSEVLEIADALLGAGSALCVAKRARLGRRLAVAVFGVLVTNGLYLTAKLFYHWLIRRSCLSFPSSILVIWTYRRTALQRHLVNTLANTCVHIPCLPVDSLLNDTLDFLHCHLSLCGSFISLRANAYQQSHTSQLSALLDRL